MQSVCSPDCAFNLVFVLKLKKDKAEHKVKVAAAKSKSKWLAETQAIANHYARVRDSNDGCISCDKLSDWHGQWHGSHFRSVGAASAVRFNLWNIHKSCSVCNNYLSGNIGAYTPRIIGKIGQEKVDWLYTQNKVTSYSVDYLKKYKHVIGKRLRRMIKSRNN